MTYGKFNNSGVPSIEGGNRLSKTEWNETFNCLAPVGTVLPWAKTLTGVPNIPTGWCECDGSTISDSESALNGVTIPDINGDAKFLRGNSTSSGSATTTGHTHTIVVDGGPTGGLIVSPTYNYSASVTGSTQAIPPCYDVVYIIRYK